MPRRQLEEMGTKQEGAGMRKRPQSVPSCRRAQDCRWWPPLCTLWATCLVTPPGHESLLLGWFSEPSRFSPATLRSPCCFSTVQFPNQDSNLPSAPFFSLKDINLALSRVLPLFFGIRPWCRLCSTLPQAAAAVGAGERSAQALVGRAHTHQDAC